MGQITWAKPMETFCPGDRSRRVYGFDHFAGLQDFAEANPTLVRPPAPVAKRA